MPLTPLTDNIESNDDPVDNPQLTREERLQKVLKILRDGCISLLDFVLDILDDRNSKFSIHLNRFFMNPSGKLGQLLDHLFEDKRSNPILLSWMEPHAIVLVSDKVAKEMDEIKGALEGKICMITPESLLTWDINSVIGPLVQKSAPTLGHLLQVAAQTTHARENNKIKSCVTVCASVSIRYQYIDFSRHAT